MKVVIVPYNEEWKNIFAKESDKIASILSEFCPTIEHIGSTSVEGLAAKPIIDILVGLNDESHLEKVVEPMVENTYTYVKKFEDSWPTRRFFLKLKAGEKVNIPETIDANDNVAIGKDFISLFNIHVIIKNTYDWNRHIAFRNYLRTYPAVKEEYQSIKLNLAKQEFETMQEYNDGKNDFIKRLENLALEVLYN